MQFRGIFVDLCGNHVVRNDIFEVIEPERRHLGQHFPFVGNRRGQDHVESGKAIGRDDQKMLTEIINITDFAAAVQLDTGQIGFGILS